MLCCREQEGSHHLPRRCQFPQVLCTSQDTLTTPDSCTPTQIRHWSKTTHSVHIPLISKYSFCTNHNQYGSIFSISLQKTSYSTLWVCLAISYSLQSNNKAQLTLPLWSKALYNSSRQPTTQAQYTDAHSQQRPCIHSHNQSKVDNAPTQWVRTQDITNYTSKTRAEPACG